LKKETSNRPIHRAIKAFCSDMPKHGGMEESSLDSKGKRENWGKKNRHLKKMPEVEDIGRPCRALVRFKGMGKIYAL